MKIKIMNLDLLKIKKAYFIGIKGAGIVAIVQILKSMGIEIAGSDTAEKFFTDNILAELGIKYSENFSAENITDDIDLVIYSTAYNEDNNPELAEAKKREIRTISYPEILGYLFNQKYGIAVCGTHGKTTAAAMLACALQNAGCDPDAIIGGRVNSWGHNALIGKGEYFIAETDEFQNKLKFYDPKAAILTSCDWDHPDFFDNFGDYKRAFADFVARIPKTGFLVVWGDSVSTLEVSKSAGGEVLTYGFGEECDYRISNVKNLKPVQKFEVFYNDKSLGEFEIKLIGKFNILNAAAIIAVCHKLNLDMEKVKEALKNFQGTARRFEYVGERNGAILIDDYAHHPEEIKATLQGAREFYAEKNIWAIFHPHTFTRTKAFLEEFSQSFSDADKVIVLDIYGSVRETQGGVSSQDLVKLINKYDHDRAEYIPTIPEAAEFLKNKIGENDVVITIGAGNVWELAEKLTTDLH